MAGQGIDEIQRLKAAEQMALEQVSDARECTKCLQVISVACLSRRPRSAAHATRFCCADRKQKMRQAVTDADTSIKQYEATLEAELDSRHAPVRVQASSVMWSELTLFHAGLT